MQHLRRNVIRSLVCTAACLSIWSVASADPPTVADVLKAHQANLEKLKALHLRVICTQEWTEAHRQSRMKQAELTEVLLDQLRSDKGDDLLKSFPGYKTRQQAEDMLKEQAEHERMFAQNRDLHQRFELFVDGDDYQVRSLSTVMNAAPDADWKIPDAAVTVEALRKEFAKCRIYSRSALQTPAARIWPGRPNPDARATAMITSKYVSEVQSFRFPPFSKALGPQRAHWWHPIDAFFSAPAERYRVVGDETRDGRPVTLVEVAVPTEGKSGERREDGEIEYWSVAHFYRGWLDMERGAIPVELQFWFGREGTAFEEVSRTSPFKIIRASDIRQLESGAFYPAQTVEEQFNLDPQTPQPTAEEWAEVRAGKRTVPTVVHERLTWNCELVESSFPHDATFFVLSLPQGQPLFDLDVGRMVGVPEPLPPIAHGQPAPALNVVRWLDGRQHALDEFRGQVVMLDFWGLWCGPCRNYVPAASQLQERFQGQPVVFISIHTADEDAAALAERIRKFSEERNWRYLAAIDAGTMTEDSRTCHAYGVTGFPTQVIVGRDGRVTYNSDVPPPGMEGIFGKPCDEVTAEETAKLEAFEKEMFEAAGETWPPPTELKPPELNELLTRVNLFHLSQRIEEALVQGEEK